jgi:shikimate dehydrogenase
VTDPAPAACVVGWPIGHSRSPLIHNYWLKTYRIAGEYRREAVPPQAFRDFMLSLKARGYVGANVTVPHKQAALACSQADDRGRAVGAANTLWLDDGVLRSTNSDVEGFLNNLDSCAPDWDRSLTKAVVLGAGGAARAVTYGLIERGIASVVVANRTERHAQELSQRFDARVRPVPWQERDAVLADAALVVNTTTLGMTGQPELMLDLARLPDHAIVVELVYAPLVTPLLRAARARGLRSADGLGMLMHQAVRGFTVWFGKKPEVTAELRALLEADLQAAQERPAE